MPRSQADVIVVGGGNAAFCAALAAQEQGVAVADVDRFDAGGLLGGFQVAGVAHDGGMTQDAAGCKNGRRVSGAKKRGGRALRAVRTGRPVQGCGLTATLMALAEPRYFFASALISLRVIER